MEQAQRVVNQAWVTKMKVKKRRAADEFFTTPELSKERKAKKARRTNAIEESFAEAKLLNLEARLVGRSMVTNLILRHERWRDGGDGASLQG